MANKKFDISLTLSAVDRMTTVINRAVNNGISKLNKFSKEADKIASASSNFAQNAGAMGLAAGAALAVPVKTAVEFEAAMAKVSAITRSSEKDMLALTKAARELGRTTQFSAMEAAEGQRLLAMAGFDTQKIITALPSVLNLAAAGAVDLGEATSIAAGIMGGFGKEAKDLASVNDILVNTFTSSKTSLQTLGETMKFAAPIAKSLKIPIQDVAAMAGKLGDAGIDASMAGTALRGMMMGLTSPSGPAKKAIQSLGVAVADQSGNMRPMLAILDDIAAKTSTLGTAQRMDVLGRIFGREPASAVLKLLDKSGGELAQYSESLTESGAASDVAGRQMKSAMGAIKLFQSALQDLFIEAGNTLIPALTSLTKKLTAIIGKVSAFASANPRLTKTILVVTAAFSGIMLTLSSLGFIVSGVATLFSTLAALGPVLLTAIGAISTAFSGLTAVLIANPIGATIAGIALAALLIYKYWQPIKDFFAGIFSDIQRAFDQGIIQGVIEVLKNINLTYWMAKAFNELSIWLFDFDLFEAGANIIGSLLKGLKSGYNSVIESISGMAGGLAESFKSVLGIASPSKVFMQYGVDIARGTEIGMNKGGFAAMGGASAQAIAPASRINSSTVSNVGGAVNLTYAPVVNITGGSESDRADFMQMMKAHKRDIMNMLADEYGRQSRLSY